MTHKEILEKFSELSKQIEVSAGKDATVMPHKWDMIRRQKVAIDAMLRAFAYVQVQALPFVPTAPKLEVEEEPAPEEPQNLLGISSKKGKKNA